MILVTGGTGLVGSRLLFELISEGKTVRALKRESSSLELFELWTAENPTLRNKVEWINGDLLDIYSIEEALVDIDTIYHCAAMISFVPSESKMMERTNIEGTANLVNCSLNHPTVKVLCHVSSVATLGRAPEAGELDEKSDWIPGSHNSNYAISKYGAEREVWRGGAEGLQVAIVNPSIILGPGDWKTGSSALFGKVRGGFPFYTDGISGFVDVRDVTKAMRFLVDQQIFGERFILNADNIGFKKLFDLIAKNLKIKSPSIKISKVISALVWRLEYMLSLITKSKPFITKETAYSAHQQRYYSPNKIKSKGFSFYTIEESVALVCNYMK
jgi:nucleoside-diphosphate-sugar epimerase